MIPIAPIASSAVTSGIGSIGGIGAAGGAAGAPAPGFADAMANGLQSVSQLEFGADAAIQDVATGGDTSIQELMTATSKAQLGIELVAQVRDKALEAYNEIMRMQL